MTLISTSIINQTKQPVMLQAVYADQHTGEWVNYQIGDKVDRRFHRPTNDFYRPGGRAIVLGNGPNRQRFPLKKFNQSNAYKRLETYNILYGCNLAYTEEGDLDFLVINNILLSTHVPRDLHEICYATPEIQRIYTKMDLIPVNRRLDAGTTAAMLACYHGNDKVFLFGFDGFPDDSNQNIYAGRDYYAENGAVMSDLSWQENLKALMIAYPDVMFYRVDSNPPNARILTVMPNYRLITFNEFVSLADL